MSRFLIFFLFLIHFFLINVSGQDVQGVNGTWTIVSGKSEFNFKIPVMFIFPVNGSFAEVNGTIEIRHDLLEVNAALIIDPASVDTGNGKRDEHLRSEDFFHVEKYPEIRFTASRIENAGMENKYTVEGDLTIKDVTETINVPVILEGINDQGEIVFTGSKNINRREYNIDYSGRGLSDTAELDFKIVGSKKQ
jgi:polyisoprenoid-binding protein YceI